MAEAPRTIPKFGEANGSDAGVGVEKQGQRSCDKAVLAQLLCRAGGVGVAACASTSNGVMGVPKDRVTAMRFLLHGVGVIVGLVAAARSAILQRAALGAGVSLAGIALALSRQRAQESDVHPPVAGFAPTVRQVRS